MVSQDVYYMLCQQLVINCLAEQSLQATQFLADCSHNSIWSYQIYLVRL